MADISLTVGADTKTFDLAKENKQKLFTTKEETIIPVKALSDVPSYGDLPPEKILAFIQNNWRGGMGQKNRFNVMDMFADGRNIDTREPNQIILGPKINTAGNIAATIILQDFYGDAEYVASTRYVWRWSGTAWTEVLDTGGDTIECIGHYDGRIYVGLEGDGPYCSVTGDNGTWAQPGLDNSEMHEVCVAPSFTATKDIFVLAKRPNEVRTSVDPATGSWTDPPYYVGDEGANITNLFVMNGTLFIGKTDGLYALPADGRPVMVLSFKEQKSNTNFAYRTDWQGIEYMAAIGDILEVVAGSGLVLYNDYVGPLTRSPELAATGEIKGITSDGNNLYAVFLVGTDYIIYAGRERGDEKYGLRWEWTPYIYLGANVCGSIKVMQRSGANPRLWFAYGTNMAYAILASSPGYPLGDTAYRFCSEGYLITTFFDTGYDTWAKIFYQLWSIAENLTTGITIDVHYWKDTDADWSVLTTITSNGVQSVDLASLACKKVRLKFTLKSGTDTVTPILREFIYRGVLQPEVTKTLDFTVILGQSDSRKPSTDLAFLESGRIATAPVILQDLRFGTTKYVTFLPNSPMEIEATDEVSKQPSYRARVLAQQLNWTKP